MGISWRSLRDKTGLASSGDAIDDELLADIARRSDINAPREWAHYLYFVDETAARAAAVDVAAAGWRIKTVEPSAGPRPKWLVIAETHAVTTHTAVRDARLFFNGIAAAHPGGEYDGWDVSI